MIRHPYLHSVTQVLSRRAYLLYKHLQTGADMKVALQRLKVQQMAHPEWNMNERKTWGEWERTHS